MPSFSLLYVGCSFHPRLFVTLPSFFSQSNYLFHPSPARFKSFEVVIPKATFKFKCERYVDGPRPKNCFSFSVCVNMNGTDKKKSVLLLTKHIKPVASTVQGNFLLNTQ